MPDHAVAMLAARTGRPEAEAEALSDRARAFAVMLMVPVEAARREGQRRIEVVLPHEEPEDEEAVHEALEFLGASGEPA